MSWVERGEIDCKKSSVGTLFSPPIPDIAENTFSFIIPIGQPATENAATMVPASFSMANHKFYVRASRKDSLRIRTDKLSAIIVPESKETYFDDLIIHSNIQSTKDITYMFYIALLKTQTLSGLSASFVLMLQSLHRNMAFSKKLKHFVMESVMDPSQMKRIIPAKVKQLGVSLLP